MAEKLQKLWVEKYQPKTLEGYIFQNTKHARQIGEMVYTHGEFPNLLLSGSRGSGKTTLAHIIFNELNIDDADIMQINASMMQIDDVRDRIQAFVTTFPIGRFKVVFLEEADHIPPKSQGALRKPMELYMDNVRFILTCNYPNQIIPEIHSRCTEFYFKEFPMKDVFQKMEYILTAEHVEYTQDLLDTFVSVAYPDIRKIIHLLQHHTFEGKLTSPTAAEQIDDYKFEFLGLLETDNWVKIRELLCANVADNEWDDVYRFIYKNLHKSGKFSNHKKWEEGILVISGALYKHRFVSDPEINFAECIIRLSRL